MIKGIPDHIMRDAHDPLNEDVRRVFPKSRQLYVSDIMERIIGMCDIQIIRIDTYTDGKNFVIVNTREVVYKSLNMMLMGKSRKEDPSKEAVMQDILDLPVTALSFYTKYADSSLSGYNLFVDSEYLDKLEV